MTYTAHVIALQAAKGGSLAPAQCSKASFAFQLRQRNLPELRWLIVLLGLQAT